MSHATWYHYVVCTSGGNETWLVWPQVALAGREAAPAVVFSHSWRFRVWDPHCHVHRKPQNSKPSLACVFWQSLVLSRDVSFWWWWWWWWWWRSSWSSPSSWSSRSPCCRRCRHGRHAALSLFGDLRWQNVLLSGSLYLSRVSSGCSHQTPEALTA